MFLFGVAIICIALVVSFTVRDGLVLLGRRQRIQANNVDRYFRIATKPSEIDKIVIGLHGFGDSSRRFAYYSALHNVVDEATLVVYPDAVAPAQEGILSGWNAGFCCGSGWKNQVDDVAFLEDLIKQLKADYSATGAQVFIVGFSNGAFMAMRLAAERPALIDGVVAASGTIGTQDQRISPADAVPILLMHGEQDDRVTYSGGAGPSDPDFAWLPFSETVAVWREANGNTAPTKVISYPDDAHQWHDWRLINFWHKQPEASKEVMRFFTGLSVR